MTLTPAQKDVAQRIAHDVPNLDESLPHWARRSNPIVRRELREYWRVFPPEARPILFGVIVQAVILLISITFPLIFIPVIIAVLIAVIMFPFLLYNYGAALIALLQDASHSMAREYEQNTIHLLRATPYTTQEIILSKITAAVWRRMDIFVILTTFTVTLGMPIIVVTYLNLYPPEQYPLVSQGLSFVALIAHLIRVPLELFMASGIAVLMGAAARSRPSAYMASLVLVAFYFILINLLRFISVHWPIRLFLDAGIPVILPVMILLFCIWQTKRILQRH
jgi:hypothetical protein